MWSEQNPGGASILGAKLLLRLKLLYPDCKTFGDIGFQVLGTPGKIWGNLIQLGNFCLFMPCALRFCGLALKGIGNFPGFDECVDYYVFVVAFVCLVTTQVRSFKNAQCFTVLSLACVIGMVLSMVYASFRYENPHKIPAMWFGNPEPEEGLRLIRLAGGCSIAAWAFIPGFLTVELSSCLAEPSEFNKSLLLAGALNVLGPLGSSRGHQKHKHTKHTRLAAKALQRVRVCGRSLFPRPSPLKVE